MYALTIKQPWASAIMAGAKRVENRTWRTDYRGPLAIHAGLSIDVAGEAALTAAGVELPPQDCEDCPRGVILGYVDLVDVVRYPAGGDGRGGQGTLFEEPDPYGLADDPLATGPWCWILREPRSLPRPVACSGRQGLWPITPSAPRS